MRILNLFTVGLIALTFGNSDAHAEARKGLPSESIHYFILGGASDEDEGFLGDLPAEGFVKEVRQGARITSAVIDICHSESLTSPRKDRFVLTLMPRAEGTRLIGFGQTQEAKQRVAVDLLRKQSGKTVSFEGTITLGDAKWDLASADNTDMSEEEFLESRSTEGSIIAEPSDFTQVHPGSIAIRVKRASLAALVKQIKGQNVEVLLDSLPLDCLGLRSGEQELRLSVDPERAPALVNALKGATGVVAAGWTDGGYSIDQAVRVVTADWGGSGSFDKQRLASAVSSSLAKNFGATVETTQWNPATGELTVALKRPSQSVPGLDLSDRIEVVLLIGPEKPASNTGLVIWLGYIAIDILDDGPGPRLKFVTAASEAASLVDKEALLNNLAADLKGKRWDPDRGAWH